MASELVMTHVFIMTAYGRMIKFHSFSRISQLPLAPLVVLFAVGLALTALYLVEKQLLQAIRYITRRQLGHSEAKEQA